MSIDWQLKQILKIEKVDQIGIVVRDIEKAINNYTNIFGIVFHRIYVPEYFNRTYRGEPGNFRMKIAIGKMGELDIELIQVLEGETIYGEFLEKRGEGLHHLGFVIKDMDERIAALKKLGIGVMQSGQRVGSRFAYMDTEKIVGVIIEYLERQ